jgi:T5SS/PEP-CTERM-associated repeat protein
VSTQYTEVGAVSGSNGTVTVDGSGSTLSHSSYLVVGVAGTGSLAVEGGAEVTVGETSGLGIQSGSVGTGTVRGAGSTWDGPQDLYVAYGGTASLTVQQGGAVNNANGFIGSESGSDGSVLVDGDGSTWGNTGSLYVGGNDVSAGGSGVLTVTNGGGVTAGGTLRVWGTGSVDVDAGQLDAGTVDLDGGGLSMGGGAAEVTVDSLLRFGPASALAAATGSSVYMQSASLENLSTDEAALAGLSGLELVFEGNPAEADDLEVACEDRGALPEAYADNFALGELRIGGAGLGHVRLVDGADNGNRYGEGGAAEALYVDSLVLGAGSVLDLNNLNLYWRTAFVDNGGTILNGSVTQVGEQTIFYPSDDAFVSMEEPDRNWSSDGYLSVRNRYGGLGEDYWERNSLLKFDLASIEPGATIASATLRLYYFDCIFSNCTGRNLDCRKVTSGWDEDTTTWNTRPATAPTVSDAATVPSASGWMEWDVTSDVRAIVDGEAENEGWQIADEITWGAANIPDARFRAKEYGDDAPHLEIVYGPEVPSLTGRGAITLALLLSLLAVSRIGLAAPARRRRP